MGAWVCMHACVGFFFVCVCVCVRVCWGVCSFGVHFHILQKYIHLFLCSQQVKRRWGCLQLQILTTSGMRSSFSFSNCGWLKLEQVKSYLKNTHIYIYLKSIKELKPKNYKKKLKKKVINSFINPVNFKRSYLGETSLSQSQCLIHWSNHA